VKKKKKLLDKKREFNGKYNMKKIRVRKVIGT